MKSKKLVKEKRLTNPHKVNQYTGPDPRQALFFSLYFDPTSDTFGNTFQSGIKAGFEESYATNLISLMPDWLSRKLDEMNQERLVRKAEMHLQEVIDLPIIMQAMGAFGPVFRKEESFVNKKFKNGKTKRVKVVKKIPVMVPNTSVIKEKTAVVKFTLESLDRGKYGNTKQPGNSFIFNIQQVKDRYKTAEPVPAKIIDQ